MPSLTEVEVWGLSTGKEELLEVQSEACAWRILKTYFPSCLELGRFTSAMPLLHLYGVNNVEVPSWFLGADVEGPAMAKAATWLSQLRSCPEKLSLNLRSSRTASSTGLISSLAPLAGRLVSLGLCNWPVSVRTLDELAFALPSVSKLSLWNCSISDSAWTRMLSLISVTDLSIGGPIDGITIPLAQIIAFASAVSRPFTLAFGGSCVSKEDQAGWEAFEKSERRQNNALQYITVHIYVQKPY